MTLHRACTGPPAFPGKAITIHGFPKFRFTLEIASQHLFILGKDHPQLLLGQER